MKRKIFVKASTLLLTIMLLLFIASIFASNIILKREFDKTDKSDMYWNYGKILTQPFKHLVIEGGNVSGFINYISGNITFEQNKNPSVRVLKNWVGYTKGSVKAFVKNDTLFVRFPEAKTFDKDNYYLKQATLVRIFCPELLSIDGVNTDMRLLKLTQNNLAINMSGGSQVQVERLIPGMDSVNVHTKDSSEVKFIMSYKYEGRERMKVGTVNADIEGRSLLDFGDAEINSLNLNMSDSASILLSGDALEAVKK